MSQPKPTQTPEAIASLLFAFLDWANTDELQRFHAELADHARNACPQGGAVKVGVMAEACSFLASGAMDRAFADVEEAGERLANAPRAGKNDHRPDGNDERDEARDDLALARSLHRLICKHYKRTKATAEDILCQVPN